MEIKTNAKEYFSNQQFTEAINTLFALGVKEFTAFSKKEEWFKDSSFCKAISNNPRVLSQILQSKKADELLHDYFVYSIACPEFETLLAEELPELFIKSIRVNQVYTKPDRIEFLISLNLSDEHKIHQKVWEFLNKRDSGLWDSILTELNLLSNAEFGEIITELIIWLENKRFRNSSPETIQHLASVYSFFIKLILQKYPHKTNLITKEKIVSTLFTKIVRPINSNFLDRILNFINEWIQFNNSILSAYSYDLDIQPINVNGIIQFVKQPEDFYRWKLDGIRYNFNRLDYLFKGSAITKRLIENEDLNIPKGIKPEDQELNFQLAVQQWQLQSFLDDLKLESLVFQGKAIKSQLLFLPLLTYTKNKQIRYELWLNHYSNATSTWEEAFQKLTKDSFLDNFKENFPFILMTNKEFNELTNCAIQDFPETVTDDIINLFSYPDNQKYQFDRFNIRYNVWQKPFIKISELIFCPVMFLANNDWFYSFSQAGIEKLHPSSAAKIRKDTSKEMEEHLGNLFRKKNCVVKIVGVDFDEKQIEGDVDLIVSNDSATLLIQLKRTKFRLDLKETYYESINTDRKASQQLNDSEVDFQRENAFYKISDKAYKWIVTTSFENILTKVEGCLKVNYFDLLRALSNPEINELENLISYIENDSGLKAWLKLFTSNDTVDTTKQTLLATGLPLHISEPNMYRQTIFAENESFLDYQVKYSEALTHAAEGNEEKAIKILLVCASENPNDYEVWFALANIYADVKDFNNSFTCFDKALQIIPDDPFILKEYALAHRDNGEFLLTIKLYSEIHRRYWFLDLS